jgi:hypothetical protein
MIDRYPHAPECWLLNPWPDGGKLSNKCSCGATALQSAFEAGKREAYARLRDRYIKALYAHRALVLDLQDGEMPNEDELRVKLAVLEHQIDTAEREERIRALKDIK